MTPLILHDRSEPWQFATIRRDRTLLALLDCSCIPVSAAFAAKVDFDLIPGIDCEDSWASIGLVFRMSLKLVVGSAAIQFRAEPRTNHPRDFFQQAASVG